MSLEITRFFQRLDVSDFPFRLTEPSTDRIVSSIDIDPPEIFNPTV